MNNPPAEPPALAWTSLAGLAYGSRRVAFAVAVGAAITAALGTFFLPKQWRSEAVFMPQVRQAGSGIGGIAAQLGVEVPSADPTQSPHFYVELLRSTQFLRRASANYLTSGGDSAALSELLGVTHSDSSRTATDVGEALVRRMVVVVTPRTGVVSVSLRLSDPVVARSVLVRLLDELDSFNVERRRSRAQAERKFTESRASELRVELREAEDQLEEFLRRNRITQFSPELTFQRDRLLREVTLRQQVYATMVQAFEQARIDEVRDTPVLTRLTGPTLPDRPDGPGLLRSMVIWFFGGLAAALIVSVAAPFLRAMRFDS